MFDLDDLYDDEGIVAEAVYEEPYIGDDLYFEETIKGVPIIQCVRGAMEVGGYTHNFHNVGTVWLTPVSEDVIYFGNGHPFNVIYEVVESFSKDIDDSLKILFFTKCAWFVIKMESSESRIPNKPWVCFSGGMIRSRNKLWHSYFRQLQARTSNYIM